MLRKGRFLLLLLVMVLTIFGVKGKVYANEQESYTVTFKSEEGYVMGEADKKELICQITKGFTIMSDTRFMSTGNRPGYALVGWKIQGGDDKIYNVINGQNSNVENIMMYYPSSDVTFIAVWEKTYKITFKTEEGYIGEIGKTEFTSLVKKGEKLSYSNIPIAKSDDHIFVGWKKTDETPVIYSTDELYSITPTEDMVFVAQWIECYVVKFHTDEGNLKYRHADYNDLEKDYSVKIKKGTELNCDIIAERDGYIFTGWKIDGEATTYNNDPDSDNYISNYTPTGNVTFIAQWEKGCLVTFHSEESYYDDTNIYDKKITLKIGDKINNNFYYDHLGYIIKGWKINNEGELYGAELNSENSIYNYTVTKDVTFVAQWEKACVVTFTTVEELDNAALFNKKYTIKKNTKIISTPLGNSGGYYIKGWKKDGEDRLYTMDDSKNSIYNYTVTEDVTFVAVLGKAYIITFHSDYDYYGDSDFDNDQTTQVIPGERIEYTVDYSPRGYIIKGWKLQEDNSYTFYSERDDEDFPCIYDYVPTGDVTFIAQWAEGYNVTYYSEQGYVGNPSDEDKAFSEPIEKGKNIYSVPSTDRPGYECIGWKVSGNESLILVYDKSSDNYIYNYKPEGNTYLIAVWKKTEDKEDKKQDEDKKVEVTDKPAEDKTQDKTPQAEAPKGGNDEQKGVPVGEVAVDKDIKYIVESEDSVIYEKNDSDKAEVNIPDVVKLNGKEYKVTEISEKAFANNKKLKKITFGSNIEAVGKNAFAGCVNLTNVNVKGNNLKEIKEGAFKGCKKLKQLTLSKNIDTIGNNAFYGDTILKTIVIKSKNVKKIGKNAFKNINKKSTIYVPKKLSNKQFNKYKKMLKKAGLPSTVKIKKK